MFNSLFGIVSEKHNDGICLNCGAIEWFIIMPIKEIEKLTVKEEARIYTYLQHTESLMQLFGFTSKKERLLFLDLIKVNGIGPKQSVKILSNIEAQNLIEILEIGDVNALQKLPGVGKITAQKMMLTLQGKLTSEKDFTESAESFEYTDILTALTEMGFDRRQAKDCIMKIVAEVKKSKTKIDETEILRATIVELSTR